MSVYYLDDIWLMGTSRDECNSNVVATCKLLIDAGCLINEGKSVVAPSRTVKFLGFTLNSVTMTVSLPLEKRGRITSMCTALNEQSTTSIRFLAKVIGVLVSSLPAVPHGALYFLYTKKLWR